MYHRVVGGLLGGMKAIVSAAALVLLLAAGCGDDGQEPTPSRTTAAAATLPACSQTWTLAANITPEAAAAPCSDVLDHRFTPTVLDCDPSSHHGVPVQLVLGPDGDYAVFVDGATSSEVDDGSGTGDYRDTATDLDQRAACSAQ